MFLFLDDIADSTRADGTLPIQESTPVVEDPTSSNAPNAETNVIESDQIGESGGESNLRDAFTSYFMFDDDERVEPGKYWH